MRNKICTNYNFFCVNVANKGLNVMLAHNSTKKTMQIFIDSSIFPTERHPFDHVYYDFSRNGEKSSPNPFYYE